MRRALGLAIGTLAVTGCSSLLGIQDLNGLGGGDGGGAAFAKIKVTGVVRINLPGQPPYSTLVELVRPDGTVVKGGNSGSDGTFSLTADTEGSPLDVALHVASHESDSRDMRVYFPAPLVADRDAGTVVILLDGDVQSLTASFGQPYVPAMTLIAVQVRNGGGALVNGAKVTTEPSSITIGYTNGSEPSAGNMTTADGTAYVFDDNTQVTALAASGTVTVMPRHVRGIPAGLLVVDLRP